MLLSRIELLAAAEIMKLKSGKYDDVFSEKYDGILKSYENIKTYCNKKAKDFIYHPQTIELYAKSNTKENFRPPQKRLLNYCKTPVSDNIGRWK